MKNIAIGILLFLACMPGCQNAEPLSNVIYVSMRTSECPLDTRGVDVNSEYNGDILDLVTIEIGGRRLQTMGFYPYIDLVSWHGFGPQYYTACIDAGRHKGAYLFIYRISDGDYLLFKGADDGAWPFNMPEITPSYIRGLFDSYKYAFVKIDENNVYVWDELYDFLRDNKVKIPSNYIPVKLWFKPDGDEKGSTQAASQSATRSATQPTTQPKNENGGGEKK